MLKKEIYLNALNSVLLEGELIADPLRLNSKYVRFIIASASSTREHTAPVIKTGYFPVIVSDEKLGIACLDTLKKGRGVRVVGSLFQISDFDSKGNGALSIEIVAEHVEFKSLPWMDIFKVS